MEKQENIKRYICIHGHFYQPFRKNPWIEKVELQEGSFPYHDWNEKITAECYSANGFAHILNSQNKLEDVVNNYSRISFNFGPTLLEWLKENKFKTFERIIKADTESFRLFSGHGSAIAQTYNHLIMPFADREDKYLQVYWAIKDFENNFNRKPEGMWIAETAVDYDTLEALAEFNIKFTILSPDQALKFRKIFRKDNKEENWAGVTDGNINTRMPYLCRLPSGKEIVIFFYDKSISIGVSFGDLLSNGENFAGSLINAPFYNQEQPEIIIIASDGETYGHHKKFGDMALAYCLKSIGNNQMAKLTVFGEYLENFPPAYEVKIIENTSWSCRHSLCRWKEDCGCSSGEDHHSEWNQKWRAPLREAVSLLRTKIDVIFKKEVSSYIKPEVGDPLVILLDYINVINDRSDANVWNFLNKYLIDEIKPEIKGNYLNNKSSESDNEIKKSKFISLLEMQRQAMLMQSSDGWFFDDIYRIESIQILRHACRAIELAEDFNREDLENMILKILVNAKSNLNKDINGASIYNKEVKGSVYSPKRVAAHLISNLLFNGSEENNNPDNMEEIKEINNFNDNQIKYDFYNYKTQIFNLKHVENNYIKIVSGTAASISKITLKKFFYNFAGIYNKDYLEDNLKEKVILCIYINELSCKNFNDTLNYADSFSSEIEKIIKNKPLNFLDDYFEKLQGFELFTFDDLSKEKQIEILNNIINNKLNILTHNIAEENNAINVFHDYVKPWINYDFIKDDIGNFDGFLNKISIYNILREKDLTHQNIEKLSSLINKFQNSNSFSGNNCSDEVLNFSKLNLKTEGALFALLDSFSNDLKNELLLKDIINLFSIFGRLKININTWEIQNILFEIQNKIFQLKEEKRIILDNKLIQDFSYLIKLFGLASNLTN